MLNLNHITDVKEANEALKGYIDGYLYLNGLTSAEGLVLPKEIDGYLSLDGLTSAEGLVLPEKITFSLSLDGLTSEEKDKLKAQRPDLNFN